MKFDFGSVVGFALGGFVVVFIDSSMFQILQVLKNLHGQIWTMLLTEFY